MATLLALAGVAAWLLVVHLTAWVQLNRGKAALERDDPEEARDHLRRCLETWPRSSEAHFRAAEAARRCGDLDAATRHLKEAADRGWAADAVALERALITAQSGNLADVESGLRRDVADGHPKSAQILAVLVPAYQADFRLLEAAELSARWVELQPRSVQAWAARADILERLRKRAEAIDTLRHLVTLAPNHRPARLALARLLLGTNQALPEAEEHLLWLSQHDPGNPTVLVQLAVCRKAQGRVNEAATILDQVIARQVPDPDAYHQRGAIELNRGRAAEALPLLRRAAELAPFEPELLYTLLMCLQQVGTAEQIRDAEERWKRCNADLKRVSELARAIVADPQDPELRREMGELFLRNGREQEGLHWLQSVLRDRPTHESTRRALADYYDRKR